MRKKMVISVLGIVLMLLLLLCCGCMNGGLLGVSEELTPKLQTVELNSSHSKIEIDVPFELDSMESPNYNELEEYIDKKIFSVGENSFLAIRVVGIGVNKEYYKEKKGFEFEPTLKGIADGSIKDLKDVKNTTDFKLIDTSYVEVNNNKMREIKASYVYHSNGNAVQMFIDEVVFIKNKDMWSVCVVTYDNNENTTKMVRDIIQSIKTKSSLG